MNNLEYIEICYNKKEYFKTRKHSMRIIIDNELIETIKLLLKQGYANDLNKEISGNFDRYQSKDKLETDYGIDISIMNCNINNPNHMTIKLNMAKLQELLGNIIICVDKQRININDYLAMIKLTYENYLNSYVINGVYNRDFRITLKDDILEWFIVMPRRTIDIA